MHYLKRTLSLLLALMLMLSCATVAFAEEAPALPTAAATELQTEDYTFAVNFLNATPSNEQSDYYGTWHAEYELSFNKPVTLGTDVTISLRNEQIGIADWTALPMDSDLVAGESLNLVEYVFTAATGAPYSPTFYDLRDTFSNLDLGVKLDEAFLEANPTLMATIALKLYNPETNEAVVLAKYQYGAPELPSAQVSQITNPEMTFAMNFLMVAPSPEQLAYYGEWYADFEITLNKDATFDANGTADGWLAGQYDEWSPNWVNVPTTPVTIKAGEPLKIMETAAELLGEAGLKLTYKDVYENVKDFDCGVFFDEEYLLANPDIEVKLELKMYSPDGKKSSSIGETLSFTYNPEQPELPTATATDIENEDLTFAMNFKLDSITSAQLAYYSKWFADFELTINKDVTFNNDGSADGWLAGQYDEWSANWVTVPYGKFAPVTLEANSPLKIMAFAAEHMDEPGLKYTFKEVYQDVKDFDCGIFFSPEFLLANPDLEVTLELKMYNPADETDSYVIGQTYTFTNDYVAYNTVTEKFYSSVSTALLECDDTANETVLLLKDATENNVTVLEGSALDLNGYTLTAKYVTCFGNIVDSSADNTGLLAVAANRLMLQDDNTQLPVRDGSGYRFVEVLKISTAMLSGNKFAFQPRIEPAMLSLLKQGKDATGVTIEVLVEFTSSQGAGSQRFVYVDSLLTSYLNSYNASADKYTNMFTLTLNNVDIVNNFTFTAKIVSDTGVSFAS